MNRVIWVAWREFVATALTKGFLIGVVMTPAMALVVLGAMALLHTLEGPKLVGVVALVDRSGAVAQHLQWRFDPDAAAEQAQLESREALEQLEDVVDRLGLEPAQAAQARTSVEAAITATSLAGLTLQMLPPEADLEAEKQLVAAARIRTARDEPQHGPPPRLALIVIPPEVVRPAAAAGNPPAIEAYFAPRLDYEVQARIERRVADAVVDARLALDERLAAGGLSPQDVRELVARPALRARTVTAEGDRAALGELAMFIPAGFMLLMMVAVFTGGQYLLTTTVEEKSSRVIEVLLSAVSPMQLMTGKILGQMGVGLLILVIYAGLGAGSLLAFARGDLLEPVDLVYLLVFFFIAYFLVASLMAAIGSAVNDMREAQALMTPVMVVLIIPWLVWFVIQRAPNSPLAVALSFIPGTNPFVMIIRLSGSEPVPAWQVPVAILVGFASVVAAAWAAGKIFRIGVLLYGKPPNLATLVRWVRAG